MGTCSANQYVATSAYGTAGTTAAACCTNKPACSTFDCSVLGTYRGVQQSHYEADSTKATIKFNPNLGNSNAGTCCKFKTTLCAGNSISCGTWQYNYLGRTGTTAAVCCQDKVTCANFVKTTGGTASGSFKQVPFKSLIAVIAGFFTLV
jgi:hypothetical protein